MKDLTDRQRETLDLIRAHTRRHGFPPSRKELAKSLGLSHPSSADGHLSALQTKGWIEIRPDTKRGIRLVGDADPPVPLVDLIEPTGEIAAGRAHRGREPDRGSNPGGGGGTVLANP